MPSKKPKKLRQRINNAKYRGGGGGGCGPSDHERECDTAIDREALCERMVYYDPVERQKEREIINGYDEQIRKRLTTMRLVQVMKTQQSHLFDIINSIKARHPAFSSYFRDGCSMYDLFYLVWYTVIMVIHCALYFFFTDLRTEVESLHWADAMLVVGLVIAFWYNTRQESLRKVFQSRPDNTKDLFDRLSAISDLIISRFWSRSVQRNPDEQITNKFILLQSKIYKCVGQVLLTFTSGRKEPRRCTTKAMVEVREEMQFLLAYCYDLETIGEVQGVRIGMDDIVDSIKELVQKWISYTATGTEYLVLKISEGHTTFFVMLFLYIFMPTQFFTSLRWYSIAIYGPVMMIFRSNDIIHRFYGNPFSYENHNNNTIDVFGQLEASCHEDVIINSMEMMPLVKKRQQQHHRDYSYYPKKFKEEGEETQTSTTTASTKVKQG